MYSTRILLGIDEPLTHVIAKNLISKVDSNKSIILGMSLKDKSRDTVLTLRDVIKSVVTT